MTEMPYDREVTIDWDWFAVDAQGYIGHFAVGASRRLPPTARACEEVLVALFEYFDHLPSNCECLKHPQLESHNAYKDAPDKKWFLSTFEAMAAKGLYSYYGEPSAGGGYINVCVPEVRLNFLSLPSEIQESIGRIRAPISFAGEFYIAADATFRWSALSS
jgi:hypothetical protein